MAKAADPVADLHRVERWIFAVDEYERCLPEVRKERMVKGSTGQPRLSPLISYLSQLDAQLRIAESELGLTPMARVKLGIAFGQARITAAEMNKALSEGDGGGGEIDAELAEWREA